MNRRDFQSLARIRLRDAKVLLDRGRSDAAYYLAGYVVECALKACIAKGTRRFDFPPKSGQALYTHNLAALANHAGLEEDMVREGLADPQFRGNWALVKDWTEESRYERHDARTARDLYQAIADQHHGVLRWLEQRW